jgi:hypothetical protein
VFFFCLFTCDLGLFGEQLLTVLTKGNSGIPTNLKENRAFPQTVEAASGQFEASRHATELKTDTRLKTAPNPRIRIKTILDQFRDKAARQVSSQTQTKLR